MDRDRITIILEEARARETLNLEAYREVARGMSSVTYRCPMYDAIIASTGNIERIDELLYSFQRPRSNSI